MAPWPLWSHQLDERTAMHWLRRSGVAAVIAAFVVLTLPAPAMAAGPKPPKVEPVGTLPSDYVAPAGGTIPAFTQWVTSQAQGRTIAGFSMDTPAMTFLRSGGSAGGNALVGAFGVGFSLGGAGVRAYAVATGSDVLPGICHSAAPLRFGAALMYPDLMPDCSLQILHPNEDVNPSASMSYGGVTVVYVGTDQNMQAYCYTTSGGSLPQGYFYGYRRATGGTSWGGRTLPGASNICGPGQNYVYFSTMGSAGGLVVADGNLNIVAQMVTPEADPLRSYGCTIGWSDGTFTTASGVSRRESQGLMPSSWGCAAARSSYTGGGRATSIRVHRGGETIGSAPVVRDAPLVLWKDGKSCLTWEADCVGWWTETSQGTAPGAYSCTYDGEDVALTECSVYRYTFDNRDGGCPTITDPSTGASAPWFCDKDPNSTDPGDVVTPGEDCYDADGWSDVWDPVEWVIKPIQCGFVSLIIPRPEVVADAFDAASGKWDQTMPGQIGDVVGTVFVPPDVVAGCEGPTIVLPLSVINEQIPDYEATPLSACDAPMSDFASMSRLISGAIMVFITGLGIVRRASSVVNAEGLG